MHAETLIACHECDLLLREVALPEGGLARCGRCGAELYRSHPDSIDRSLAFTLGAVVLFVISNVFPILGIEVQGQATQSTLIGAVRSLYDQDMHLVAALVFVTTVVMPVIELSAMTYLLLPLRLGRAPRYFSPVFRVLQAVRPWGMVEVFMLGVLVSLVKLAHIANVVPGVALWSFGGLMLLLAAAAAAFDPRVLWAHMDGAAP
jgi:paraquat-inducible protein A